MSYTTQYGWELVHPIITNRRVSSMDIVLNSNQRYFDTGIYYYDAGKIYITLWANGVRVTEIPTDVNLQCGFSLLVIGEPI